MRRPVITEATADKVAEIAEIQAILSSTYVGLVTWRARRASHSWFSDQHRDCHGSLVGAHVIPGMDALREPDRATVFIFPICKTHCEPDIALRSAFEGFAERGDAVQLQEAAIGGDDAEHDDGDEIG